MTRKLDVLNKKSFEQRFWDKINIDEEFGCWNTKIETINAGFYIGKIDEKPIKKNIRQVAWFIVNKEFPSGILENTCKNRKCVNPDHYVLISSFEDRFWMHTDKKSNEECWDWKAEKDIKGYGIMNYSKTTKAHRISWLIHYGDIPEGMLVCHHCDNPSCVNPNHLFLGTVKDNNLDKVSKGRQKGAQGERNHGAILNEKQVEVIRFLYSSGKYSTYFLSDVFQVSRNCISRIINNITWKGMEC